MTTYRCGYNISIIKWLPSSTSFKLYLIQTKILLNKYHNICTSGDQSRVFAVTTHYSKQGKLNRTRTFIFDRGCAVRIFVVLF